MVGARQQLSSRQGGVDRFLVRVAVVCAVHGCARDPEPLYGCHDLEPGDVRITEIRGPQAVADNRGQWIELANLTGEVIDLGGVAIDIEQLNGDGKGRWLVRSRSALVDAGGFFVMGHHGPNPDDVPPFIDYSFFTDWFTEAPTISLTLPDGTTFEMPVFGSESATKSVYDEARLKIDACGVELDSVVYRGLPNNGTHSLDVATMTWCSDETPAEDDGGPQFYIGIPGTPGETNRPCEG